MCIMLACGKYALLYGSISLEQDKKHTSAWRGIGELELVATAKTSENPKIIIGKASVERGKRERHYGCALRYFDYKEHHIIQDRWNLLPQSLHVIEIDNGEKGLRRIGLWAWQEKVAFCRIVQQNMQFNMYERKAYYKVLPFSSVASDFEKFLFRKKFFLYKKLFYGILCSCIIGYGNLFLGLSACSLLGVWGYKKRIKSKSVELTECLRQNDLSPLQFAPFDSNDVQSLEYWNLLQKLYDVKPSNDVLQSKWIVQVLDLRAEGCEGVELRHKRNLNAMDGE